MYRSFDHQVPLILSNSFVISSSPYSTHIPMSQTHESLCLGRFFTPPNWNKSVAPGAGLFSMCSFCLLCAHCRRRFARPQNPFGPAHFHFLPMESVFLACKLRNGCFHFCAAAGGRLVSPLPPDWNGCAAAGMDDPPGGAHQSAVVVPCSSKTFLAIPSSPPSVVPFSPSSKSPSSKFARPLAKKPLFRAPFAQNA